MEDRLRTRICAARSCSTVQPGALFDDGPIYQIEPFGIALPKDRKTIAAALKIAARRGGCRSLPAAAATLAMRPDRASATGLD